MNLLERIENLHGLISEAEALTEGSPAWTRGAGSKWGTAHGKTVKKGNKWVKGAYQPIDGKEYSKGVQGHWTYLKGTGPIFVITKRGAPKASDKRSAKAKAAFKGKLTRTGRMKKDPQRASGAKSGWQTRKRGDVSGALGAGRGWK